jgi:protoporphyrin/coproporphyrin ferrochelatase
VKTAILLLSFGEPESATPESVTAYLERIFLTNARLDPSTDTAAVRHRARSMAERRVPELLEDYRRIGGSPLNAQAACQAQLLEAKLGRQGHDVVVLAGMQYTDPDIASIVERAMREGVGRVIALPVYPLCGPSTTIPALEDLRRSMDEAGWSVQVDEITGWHVHPAYTSLRADGILGFCDRDGVDLADPATRLVFAVHGTPVLYLEEGSRYDLYAEDHCRRLAAALGVDRYVLGYQNHSNRPGVVWTQPDIERAIQGLDARRIVVVPVSFMQEHSETLAELDLGLNAAARELALEFHRVPVPHDDPGFIDFLALLVSPFLGAGSPEAAGYEPCGCRPGAVCLTGELVRDDA